MSKTMSTNTTNITLALAISTVLATSSQATPVTANSTSHLTPSHQVIQLAYNQTALDAFWEGQYTYCDAKVLASYWGQSIFETKARAGEKLLRGELGVVKDQLSLARNQAQKKGEPTCSFHEEGYTYDDAELLAQSWGKPTPWDAKLKINRLLMNGQNATIQQTLKQVKQQNQLAPQSMTVEDQQWNAYSGSEYTYDDAEVLAKYWGKPSPWEAKLKIGSFLMDGQTAELKKVLQQAKQQSQSPAQSMTVEDQQWNAYSGSEYTYDDAAVLAQYWGKSSPWEAKLKIGSLIMTSDQAVIKKALKNAESQH